MPNEDALPTEDNEWGQYMGPNGVPRIEINPPAPPLNIDPFSKFVANVKKQQDEGTGDWQKKFPNYVLAPDLLETQQGQQSLPPGFALNDAGIPFNLNTGAELPTVRRPNVLPIAMTPDGPTLAMPKLLDLASNVMGGIGAPAVATKAGEVVLGSGAVKTAMEAPKVAEAAQPFYSALEQAVNNSKVGKASPEQWLGYLKNQPGVKSEEIATVLKDLPQGPITKSEMQGIVQNNKVQLGEKVLGKSVQDLPKGSTVENTGPNFSGQAGTYFVRFPDGTTNQAAWKTPEAAIENALSKFNSPTKYHGYQLPGGENYKEMLLTLPEGKPQYQVSTAGGPISKLPENKIFNTKAEADAELAARQANGVPNQYHNIMEHNFGSFKSSHWDEPNVIAHVRMNDRNVPVDFTPAEKEALAQHEAAAPKLADIRNKQTDVAKEISSVAKPLEKARQASILSDLKAGKISNGEAQRRLENYESPQEIKPLQDKLEALRKQEDNLRKSLPTKPEPKTSKALHLEEWQSDLHQATRDRGYVGEKEKLQPEFDKIEKKLMDTNDEAMLGLPTVKEVLKDAVDKKIINQQEADTYKRYTDIENQTPVPDLPFKKNWEELALKRMLHEAAVKGYDALSWTPGEAQALRYQNDVRTKLDTIDWHNKSMGKVEPSGNKQILVTPAGSKSEIELTVTKNGEIIKGHPELKGKMLDSVLGKDLAKQVLEKNEGSIDAKGYVMNSEGMKAAYDKRGVDILNNLAKKYGSKVETKNARKEEILDQGNRWTKQPIHYLPITPELRAKAKQGFNLFSSVPVTVPVSHNPFDDRKKQYKLTPVAHNPFAPR